MSTQPRVVIVMGVAGAGKSTFGAALAESLGGVFVEGDDHHPQANKQKIAIGQPLDDEDRWPWLDSLCQEILQQLDSQPICVATCSALRGKYRDFIRGKLGLPTEFVFLAVSKETLERRLTSRKGHFAGISILDSQLATLELTSDLITIDAEQSLDKMTSDAKTFLSA